MQSLSSNDIIAAAASLAVTAALVAAAYLMVRYFLRRTHSESASSREKLAVAEMEADRIIREARAQARALMSETQTQSATLAAQQREELERRAKIYRESLEVLAEDSKKTIQDSIEGARREHDEIAKNVMESLRAHGDSFSQHLAGIEKDLDSFAHEMEKQAQDIRNKLATRAAEAGQHLDEAFLKSGAENRARVDKHLETLLKKAQDEIDQYREARKRIVDMHMVELVGETAKIVLHKALSADDHADLVKEALEEAKAVGAL
jgi:F0F1-type ATP synthase membrane subunit b/b'